MTVQRVIFASNVNRFSGAGHIRRLLQIAKVWPIQIEKYFFGELNIPWVSEMTTKVLHKIDYNGDRFGPHDLVILDSYDQNFCLNVRREFPVSQILQIADRYSFLLPDSQIIFADLPFAYLDASVSPRVLAHGINYLPTRRLRQNSFEFKRQAIRVLVTTGGLVNETIYSQLVDELSKEDYRDIRFEFIGMFDKSKPIPPNLNFNAFGSSFDSVAGSCDTAISTSGTTMWDLLANEIVIGITASVENQRANFDYAIRNGQALKIFNPDTLELNEGALRSLLFDSNIRSSLYKEISRKYDFDGAKRVVDVLLKSN